MLEVRWKAYEQNSYVTLTTFWLQKYGLDYVHVVVAMVAFKITLKILHLFIYLLIYLFVCVCVHACRGQKTTCRSCLSPTAWVLGIHSDLFARQQVPFLTCRAITLALYPCFKSKGDELLLLVSKRCMKPKDKSSMLSVRGRRKSWSRRSCSGSRRRNWPLRMLKRRHVSLTSRPFSGSCSLGDELQWILILEETFHLSKSSYSYTGS